jgi:hypothetical protein
VTHPGEPQRRRLPLVLALVVVALAVLCGYKSVSTPAAGENMTPELRQAIRDIATLTVRDSSAAKPLRTASAEPARTPKAPTLTTRPQPSAGPTHVGVHPGAFCDEHGDYGITTKRRLMRCTTTNHDNAYRWRKA